MKFLILRVIVKNVFNSKYPVLVKELSPFEVIGNKNGFESRDY